MTVQTKIILSFCLVVVTVVIVVWDHVGAQRQAIASTHPETMDLSGSGGGVHSSAGSLSGSGAGSLGGATPVASHDTGAVRPGSGAAGSTSGTDGATRFPDLGADTVLFETPASDPAGTGSGSIPGKTRTGLPAEGMSTGRPTEGTGGAATSDSGSAGAAKGAQSPSRPESSPAGPRTYKVRPGDYPWKIAQKVYGDGQHYKRILEANRDRINAEGTNLKVGMELVIPPLEGRAPAAEEPEAPVAIETPRGGVPASGAERPMEYVIQAGDNLSRISQQFYGTSSRWNEIYEANTDRLASPNDLTVGETIIIPPAK